MTITEFFDILNQINRDEREAVLSADEADRERQALIEFYSRLRAA